MSRSQAARILAGGLVKEEAVREALKGENIPSGDDASPVTALLLLHERALAKRGAMNSGEATVIMAKCKQLIDLGKAGEPDAPEDECLPAAVLTAEYQPGSAAEATEHTSEPRPKEKEAPLIEARVQAREPDPLVHPAEHRSKPASQPPAAVVVVWRNPADVKPHPLNATIYQERDDPEFEEAVLEAIANGSLEPIIISGNLVILAGHRRWNVAAKHGVTSVPTIMINVPNEALALINYNRHRHKVPGEIYEEARVLRAEFSRLTPAERKEIAPDLVHSARKGATAGKIAAIVGMGKETLRKLTEVLESPLVDGVTKADLRVGRMTVDAAHAELRRIKTGPVNPAPTSKDPEREAPSASGAVDSPLEGLTPEESEDAFAGLPDDGIGVAAQPVAEAPVPSDSVQPKLVPEPTKPTKQPKAPAPVTPSSQLAEMFKAIAAFRDGPLAEILADRSATSKAETWLKALRDTGKDLARRIDAALSRNVSPAPAPAHPAVEPPAPADPANSACGTEIDFSDIEENQGVEI